MFLEVYRCRHWAAMLGSTALLALLGALPLARAQDQTPANPPVSTPAPQQSTPPAPPPSAAPPSAAPASPPPLSAPSAETPSAPAPTPSPQTSGGGTQLPEIDVRAARAAPRAMARRRVPTTTAPIVPPVS